MTETYKKFLDSYESSNSKKIAKSYQLIGDYDYSNCSKTDVENIILMLRPKSPRTITTICTTFTKYAVFIDNQRLEHLIASIDKKELWDKAKYIAPSKFISNIQYNDVYKKIEMNEEYNVLFFKALFRCIYEGIYSEDLSVVKNLRGSDIIDNIITLHSDEGGTYSLEVSPELVEMLRSLAKIDVWERRNRYGTVQIPTTGVYFDSCFKVELRNSSSDYSYRYSYYRVLRKIAKEYVGYDVAPMDLYISGIMHRIAVRLKENNISVTEAFALYTPNKIAGEIISEELKRSNHTSEFSFKEIVKGHLDIFEI